MLVARARWGLSAFGFVLAVLACVVLAAAPPASAQTVPDPDYWKQTVERRDTVNRLIYSQSPQTIPPSYSAVAAEEEALRQKQLLLPPAYPKAPTLWQQIRTITVETALSTKPRALGTLGLAAGTLYLGVKIGTTSCRP